MQRRVNNIRRLTLDTTIISKGIVSVHYKKVTFPLSACAGNVQGIYYHTFQAHLHNL